jgi:hypothetical protein
MLTRMRMDTGSTWRNVLGGAALVAAVGEAFDAISIGWPALIFARAFRDRPGLAPPRWPWRGDPRRGANELEVVFWPSYERNTTADWVVQTFFLVLGAVGTVAAVGVLWTSWRSAREKASANA